MFWGACPSLQAAMAHLMGNVDNVLRHEASVERSVDGLWFCPIGATLGAKVLC